DVPGLVTMEELRGGSVYWLISMASRQQGVSTSYVTAMVLKDSLDPAAAEAEWEHNLVLAGVILACVALSGFLIAHFFRRPARDILHAMDSARGGNFESRARVRRPDELGEIAGRFNELMDDLSSRDRERDALLTRISGFNDELRAEVARATSDLRSANEA